MRICPYCQSTSFDDQETCYGCLHHFDDTDVSVQQTTPVQAIAKPNLPEVVLPTTLPSNASTSGSGMARLHVSMPEGYHYDVYLEKPEGASIQIGWIPDKLESKALPAVLNK